MILLIFFISVWFGLKFQQAYIIIPLLEVGLFVFTLKRYNLKISLISLGIFIIFLCISFIKINFNKNSYIGIVIQSSDNYFILQSFGQKLYCYNKLNQYEIGDILKLEGYVSNISMYKIESQFDFESYLNNKGVFTQFNISKINLILNNPLRIREFQTWFLNHFNEQTKGIIGSIFFSEYSDSVINNNLETLHLNRLISSSGIYLYFYLHIFEYFLGKTKLNIKWTKLISIILIFPYLLFTFPKFSVIRISSLLIFKWINDYLLNKKFNYLEIISISGIFFLLIDRYLAYQDSFVLGYLIPITLYFANDIVSGKRTIIRKVFPIIYIYILFIPFEIKYYNSINPLSTVFVPLLTPYFLILSLLSFFGFFGIPIYNLVNYMTVPLSWIIQNLKYINFELYASPFNDVGYLLYYLTFYLTSYYFSIGFKPIYRKLLISLAIIFPLYFIPIKNSITNSVEFINVGQGDSCLIRTQNHTVLIDTGGSTYSNIAVETLIPFFKKNRIYSIDLVIITHDDYDHNGSLNDLIKNFRIKKVVNSYREFPINFYGIEFLNYNNHIDSYIEDNEKSLVIGFELNKINYLITGDAPIKIEKNIINEYGNIKCDVLKVGHHGSKTSTCREFLSFLNPKDAIISVGRNNFGHPDNYVISNLKSFNINVRRTDKEGTIKYTNYIFM